MVRKWSWPGKLASWLWRKKLARPSRWEIKHLNITEPWAFHKNLRSCLIKSSIRFHHKLFFYTGLEGSVWRDLLSVRGGCLSIGFQLWQRWSWRFWLAKPPSPLPKFFGWGPSLPWTGKGPEECFHRICQGSVWKTEGECFILQGLYKSKNKKQENQNQIVFCGS